MKVEKATLYYLNDMAYKPDLVVELRPDRKRLVISQERYFGEEEKPRKDAIWVDLGDVKALCEMLNQIVADVRVARVVEDRELLGK